MLKKVSVLSKKRHLFLAILQENNYLCICQFCAILQGVKLAYNLVFKTMKFSKRNNNKTI